MELRQWFICWTVLLCLQPMPVSARHTDSSPSIDSTAHVLAHREWRIGPFTTEVGLFDSLQLNVVHAIYLAGIRNIGLKVELPSWGPVDFALSGAVFASNTKDYSDDNPDIPIRLLKGGFHASWRTGRSTYGLNALVTQFSAEGESSEDVELGGAAFGRASVASLFYEWRWGRTTAFTLEGFSTIAQSASGEFDTRSRISDRLTFRLYGQANASSDETYRAVRALVHWSFDSFNLRTGLQTGHFLVPVVDIFVPGKVTLPYLDLFWRF